MKFLNFSLAKFKACCVCNQSCRNLSYPLNNLKSVRLSDQVMDYVINFEGDGFNQKFENLVLFCMEQEETKKQKIAFLDQQIVKQYKKLDALRKISSEIGDVRKALTNLEWRANDLSDLMGKLLEDKDADPELPFS